MDIKLLKQIFNKPTWETFNEEMPRWAYVIAGIIGVVMILIPPLEGGRVGLEIQAYSVFCLFIFALIVCVVIKNKSLRVLIFTLSLALFGGYLLLLAGTLNNYPEFIRSIQGKYFVLTWLLYGVGVYLITFCIQVLCNATISSRGLEKLQEKTYSDNDIMLISGSSRYKYISYYILKAKADGLVKLAYLENIEELQILLDEDAVSRTYDTYYKENPVVKQLVEYLKERLYFGRIQTTVEYVIMNFEPNVDIYSSGGKALAKRIFKADNFKNVLICIAVCMVYYAGITKLMMGLYNEKELFNLVIYGFPISYIMVWSFVKYMQNSFSRKVKEHIFEPVIDEKKTKIADFESVLQYVLSYEGDVTEEEKSKLLRYYATNYELTNRYWLKDPESENKYAYVFLNYISEAERFDAEVAAEKIRASGSGGYYYGCSSCGGGGGGGCGGCGD